MRQGGKAPASADVEKPFRLAVKRRLSKRHREELDGVAFAAAQPEGAPLGGGGGGGGGGEAKSGEEEAKAKAAGTEARKRRLDELYNETVEEYAQLAKRVRGLHSS